MVSMTRKLQLTNPKIHLIKRDIERLGLPPVQAIIRHCKVTEGVAQSWMRFGEKMRVAIDSDTETDTDTDTDTVTVTDTVTDPKNLNPSDSYKQLTLRLYDTVTVAVTDYEAMELENLKLTDNEQVSSRNSQWLLSKKFPERYGDHKDTKGVDEQAQSLIQAIINLSLTESTPKGVKAVKSDSNDPDNQTA